MADTADEEIVRGILRNVVPFNAGQDLTNVYQTGENAAVKLLQTLGLVPPTPMAGPLPRVSPEGNIVWPENEQQVTPGDVDARRLQQLGIMKREAELQRSRGR